MFDVAQLKEVRSFRRLVVLSTITAKAILEKSDEVDELHRAKRTLVNADLLSEAQGELYKLEKFRDALYKRLLAVNSLLHTTTLNPNSPAWFPLPRPM